MLNSKILIVSGVPIWVIFQNPVTFRHADCCTRVIALLEYFKWTLSKQHIRAKGVVFIYLLLSMLVVGVDF